jgi:hypothetical protein
MHGSGRSPDIKSDRIFAFRHSIRRAGLAPRCAQQIPCGTEKEIDEDRYKKKSY